MASAVESFVRMDQYLMGCLSNMRWLQRKAIRRKESRSWFS